MSIERVRRVPSITDVPGYIDINDRWVISSDQRNVTISKKQIHQATGELYFHPKWHYNDFTMALQALVDKDIQLCDSFHDVVARIKELKVDIKKWIDENEAT